MKIKNAEKEMGTTLALSYQGKIIGDCPLKLIFYPATKRAFDLDNALASMKPAIDGLAIGLGINDKQFCPITLDRGECDKNPRVEVFIG